MSDIGEMIKENGVPLRTVKFILGMNAQGSPMQMQINRNEFQNIYIMPDEGIVIIIKTFHESDKEVFSLFYLDKFMTTEFELLETQPSLSLVKTDGVA